MKKEMCIWKIINCLTCVIAIVAVLFPIVIWKQIPDRIPTHFGLSGHADAWGDKSFLILVLLLSLVLLGVMNITVYYVKVNELSFYPMLVVTNLGIQGVFAYIIYATATAKETLGTWFIPFICIAIFGPILWYVVRYGKKKIKDSNKACKKNEKEENGIVCRSRVDLWLVAIVLVPTAYIFYEMVKELLQGIVNWPMIGSVLLIVAIIIPLANVKYVLYEEYLKVSCSYFGTERIRYEDIVSAKKTYNPISSAALSVRRIQIDYVENGARKMVLISPKNRDGFIEELKKRGYIEQ